MGLKTAVLILAFNRPEPVRRILDVLKAVAPARLYVSADGPRIGHSEDIQGCRETRLLFENRGWDCDIHRRFHERNLGCRNAVSSAIDWFFSHNAEGIILEDDCLPHPSFFRFCEELLERFRTDTRIMQICGANLHCPDPHRVDSYYFSRLGPVWGWASWKRAWDFYDVKMATWPDVKRHGLHRHFCETEEEARWRESIYDRTHGAEIDTWDYQWGYAKLIQSGLSVVPKVNLISNIGFDACGTHTKSVVPGVANVPTSEMSFPLVHPPYVMRDRENDARFMRAALGDAGKPKGLGIGCLRRVGARIACAVSGSLRAKS